MSSQHASQANEDFNEPRDAPVGRQNILKLFDNPKQAEKDNNGSSVSSSEEADYIDEEENQPDLPKENECVPGNPIRHNTQTLSKNDFSFNGERSSKNQGFRSFNQAGTDSHKVPKNPTRLIKGNFKILDNSPISISRGLIKKPQDLIKNNQLPKLQDFLKNKNIFKETTQNKNAGDSSIDTIYSNFEFLPIKKFENERQNKRQQKQIEKLNEKNKQIISNTDQQKISDLTNKIENLLIQLDEEDDDEGESVQLNQIINMINFNVVKITILKNPLILSQDWEIQEMAEFTKLLKCLIKNRESPQFTNELVALFNDSKVQDQLINNTFKMLKYQSENYKNENYESDQNNNSQINYLEKFMNYSNEN